MATKRKPEEAPLGRGMARQAAKKVSERKRKTRARGKNIMKDIRRGRGS